MLSIMLITSNEREKQILKIAFEQLKIEVVMAEPNHASYIKALQYAPDIVLIEFPKSYMEQLNFVSNMSKSKQKIQSLMVGYGYKFSEGEQKAILGNGIEVFLPRPLKFSLLMKLVEKHLGKYAPDKITWKGNNRSPDDDSYVEKIFDKDVLPTQKRDMLIDRVESLMAFPFTVARVLQLTNDPNSGAVDLAKVIEADPVIATNLVKMSNTVFFASRNRTITSIKDAIVRIGFKETKNIVMAMTVMKLVDSNTDNLGFDRKEFWLHSLATAVVSEHIAKGITTINSSEVFLAGLLHDIGIILMDEFFADLFRELLKRVTDKGISFLETERRDCVITHMDVTKELFKSWKIPENIINGLSNLEQANRLLEDDSKSQYSSDELMGLIIYAAETYVKSNSIGHECDQFATHFNPPLLTHIHKSTGFSEEFKGQIKSDINMYCNFLNLSINATAKEVTREEAIIIINNPGTIYSPAYDYLCSEGYHVQRMANYDALKASSSVVPKLIIYWNETKPDPTELGKLQAIPLGDEKGDVPVIVFEAEPTKDQDKNVKYLKNALDLRYLQLFITEMMPEETEKEEEVV